MDRESKKRQVISLTLNLAIVALECVGTLMSVRYNGGFAAVAKFYTVESNVFALCACLITAVYTIHALRSGGALPGWVKLIKYMSVCCLSVTLTVVVFILSPMSGKGGFAEMMLSRDMLYHHFLCPVLAAVSFVFFETEPPTTKRHTLIAVIPTVMYAAVTIILNLLRVMRGPYPFLYVYEQPVYMSFVWGAVILGLAWALALILRLANARHAKAVKQAAQGGV